jgi:hypothetical protein
VAAPAFLECGGLPPLFRKKLASRWFLANPTAASRLLQSGSKLPHSKPSGCS